MRTGLCEDIHIVFKHPMPTENPDSIWTRAFSLLCLAQFLGYSQYFILQPTFPLYITSLGGTPFQVGIVLSCFAVTSVLFRPFIGLWADRWSETGVLTSGLIVLAASLALCFAPFVEATMLANGLRGIGWAGLNTGGYSLLALSAPPSRRGEASGYYSGVQSGPTILLPAVALWIIDAPFGGFDGVFAVAVLLAGVGAGVGVLLGRHAPRGHRQVPFEISTSWRRDIFNIMERDIILASLLLFCFHVSLPAVASFIVLYALELGIPSIGWFYIVSGATSALARPVLGRVSDQIGRSQSLAAGFIMQTVALCMLALATNLAWLLISGALFMTGTAIGTATTLAVAVERAQPERRGRAMATFSLAFPLSGGLGALISGSAVELVGYSWMYLIAAGIGALGLALTAINWSRFSSANSAA